MTENINGKDVPVLAAASGAGIWLDNNYYRSQDLAQQQQDTTYDGESTR